MTATNPETAVKSPVTSGSSPISASIGMSRALLFGTGLGIAVCEGNLEIAVVRVRPSGAALVSTALVRDFRKRSAAEWGEEVTALLNASGDGKLPATLLLPRSQTIVRTVSLPGVPEKEIAPALDLQIDTLHPYGEEEVAWAFRRAGRESVLVGLVRKAVLNEHETLFAEAGIPLAAITFSPAAFHSALRLWDGISAPALVSYLLDERGRAEVYGESEARPVYSAEFPAPLERALAVARAELRLAPDTPAYTLREILPAPVKGPRDSASPLAYAAALVGSVPRVAKVANLLPKERRATQGHLELLVPAALAILLAALAFVVYIVFPAVDQRRYANELNEAARKLEPAAKRVQTLEATTLAEKNKILALDQFRGRAQADLDVLNELTKLLPPPIWTSTVELYPDSVVLAGEAEQAAPLLKVLDSSPLFQGSEFGLSVTRNGNSEAFRIRTIRRGRTGRNTP